MLGYGRLPDPEVPADDLDDLAGRVLTPAQDLQDGPPDRIGEDIERMHYAPV